MVGSMDSLFREEALRCYAVDRQRTESLVDVSRSRLIGLWIGAGLLGVALAGIATYVGFLL